MSLSNTEIILVNCIASYPHLFQARAITSQGQTQGAPKFSLQCILPDESQLDAINAAMMTAFEAKFGPFNEQTNPIPMGFRWPLKRVDAKTPAHQGKLCISASADADRRPGVVDQNTQPILDASELFAGCIVNVHVGFFGYNNISKGVGAGLRNVQLVRNTDVQRLDNTQSPQDVFAVIPGAPAAPQVPGMPGAAVPSAAPAAPYNPAAPAGGPAPGVDPSWGS